MRGKERREKERRGEEEKRREERRGEERSVPWKENLHILSHSGNETNKQR